MKRKTKILLISYASAAVVALAVALVACRAGAVSYETRLDANYRHAFSEVLTAVQELDTSLKKSAYAATPAMECAVCTEIYSDAQTAEMAIGVLPVQTQSLEKIARHIAVVGDYAYALSRAAAEGNHFSEEALSNLKAFSLTTSALYEQLGTLQQAIADGAVSTETHRRLTDALDNLQEESASAVDTIGAEMEALGESFPEVPALVYDGMYADRASAEMRMLSGKAEVSEEEARAAAAEFLQCPAEQLRPSGRSEGRTPCWNFDLPDGDTVISISVTVQGGEVLYFYSSCPSGEAALTHEQALAAAEDFLTRNGYENMQPCSYEASGNAETFVFAYQQGDVLCYPDLVRVKVCLESGSVLAFEAVDYLTYHTQRDLPSPLPDSASARNAVPASLQIQREQAVLIPSAGKFERFCYEYLCTDADGGQCLIYVNAETGEQERILLVQEGEGSVLWL